MYEQAELFQIFDFYIDKSTIHSIGLQNTEIVITELIVPQ